MVPQSWLFMLFTKQILTFWVGSLSQGSRHAESLSYLHISLPDVVEAALWCFWHGDALASGEMLLGVLLGRDERVRLVYGLLVGAFYMGESLGFE